MKKIKLTNCEHIFNQKQLLLDSLKRIEMEIHDQYSIVQNDNIEIDISELVGLDDSVEAINDEVEAFRKKWHVHAGAICDHLLKCHVDE